MASRLAEDTNLTIGVLEGGPDLSNDEAVVSGGMLISASPLLSEGLSNCFSYACRWLDHNLRRGQILLGV